MYPDHIPAPETEEYGIPLLAVSAERKLLSPEVCESISPELSSIEMNETRIDPDVIQALNLAKDLLLPHAPTVNSSVRVDDLIKLATFILHPDD
jgi:hypothetical protein